MVLSSLMAINSV